MSPVSVLISVVAHISDERSLKKFERAIESILALNIAEGVRVSVVVIDNASRLAIRDWVAVRAPKLISVLRREANNLGAARSQALHEALKQECDWIGFVDSDVELPQDWLMALVGQLQTLPFKNAVGIASVNRPPREGDFYRALDLFLGFQLGSLGSAQGGVAQSMKVTHLPTCAALFNVRALYDAGGFDSDFSRVGEDLEMSYRLLVKGPLWLLPGPVVVHRQDKKSSAWAKRMFRYGWGQIDVARKHPDHLLTKKVLPLLAGLVVMLALILMFVGVSAPIKVLAICYVGFLLSPIILRGISEGRMDVAFGACWIAVVTHVSYSAGMWAGLLRLCQNPTTARDGSF